MSQHSKPLFIALGHEYRSDDGIAVAIMDQIKNSHPGLFEFIHHNGDPADLIEQWDKRAVILVDAAYFPGQQAGTITVLDPLVENDLAPCRSTSSHALSLQEALSFGEILDKRPQKMRIYAVAGENFSAGKQLSRLVEEAIAPCIKKIMSSDLLTGEPHA